MADITVLGSASGSTDHRSQISPTVWVDENTGYVVSYDTSTFVCLKTTNAGTNWSEVDAAGAPAASPRSQGYGIEAVNPTPNDPDAIHVVFLDVTDDQLQRVTFDIGTETWGSIEVAASVPVPDGVHNSSNQSAMDAAVNNSGYILAPWRANQAGEVGCQLYDPVGASWSSVGGSANNSPWWGPFQIDGVAVAPANGGDNFLVVVFDENANDFRIRGYRVTANDWTNATSINNQKVTSGIPRHNNDFALAFDHINDRVLLTFTTTEGVAGCDIQCWTIDWDGTDVAPTVTQQSNVVTDDATLMLTELSIDYVSELVYCSYARGTINDSVNVYRRSSALGTISFGSESAAYFAVPDDYRMIAGDVVRASTGGRIQETVFDDDDVLLLVNDENDVEIVAAGTHAGSGSVATPMATAAGVASVTTPPVLVRAAHTVQIDRSDPFDDDFGDAGEAITQVRQVPGITTRVGNDAVQSVVPPRIGELSMELDNSTEEFGVSSTVREGALLNVESNWDSTAHPIFKGRIDRLTHFPGIDRQATQVRALGPMGRLPGRAGFSTALYQDIRVDEAIGHVLDAVGWPSDDRNLDTSTRTLEWFWLSRDMDPWQTLVQLVNTEGPLAQLLGTPDGKIEFQANDHRTTVAHATTTQATFRGSGASPVYSRLLSYDAGAKGVVNKVSVARSSLAGSATLPEVVLFDQFDNDNNPGMSLIWPMPGSLRPNDLVYVWFCGSQPGGLGSFYSPPTGFTTHPDGIVDPGGSANYIAASYFARVSDLTPGDQVFSVSVAMGLSLQIAVVRNGQDWGDEYSSEGHSTSVNASPANMNAESVAIDGPNELVLVFVVTDGLGTITPAAGYTELSENSVYSGTSSIYITAEVAWKLTTDSTDEDPEFSFSGGNGRSHMYGYSIKPIYDLVWESDSEIAVPSGGSAEIQVSTPLPFEDAQTPAVSTGDLNVSAGALASVTLNRISGAAALIEFTATAGGPVTIDSGARCRALLHTAGSSSTAESGDPTSQSTYEDRGLTNYPTWPYISATTAQALADDLVAALKDPRPMAQFEVEADRDSDTLSTCLSLEVSDQVRLLEDRANIDLIGWVEGIQHHIGFGGAVRSTVWVRGKPT